MRPFGVGGDHKGLQAIGRVVGDLDGLGLAPIADHRQDRWEFERRGEAMEIDVQGALTLDEVTLMHEAVRAGVGLSYLSDWTVSADVAAGRLIQVLDDWTPAYLGLCLDYPGPRHVPAGLRAFMDLFRKTTAGSGLGF